MNANWLPIASFIVSMLAIPTLIGLFWKDLHDKKKENSDVKKEQRKKEFQANVREVLQEELKPLNNSIDSLEKKLDLVADGTLSTLRNNIKDCFYRCYEKGYRNDYDFKNIHALYKSYRNLNGNSFIEDIMHRFDSLPPKEDFLKKRAEEEEHEKVKIVQKSKIKDFENEGGDTNEQ